MKKATIFISFLLCSLMVVSCGGGNKTSNNSLTAGISDNSETYMEENVNAIDQALPEIMILPSDRVLNPQIRN